MQPTVARVFLLMMDWILRITSGARRTGVRMRDTTAGTSPRWMTRTMFDSPLSPS